MPLTLYLRPRHLARYRQVAQTLGRHGFGFLVAELGLSRRLPFRSASLEGAGPGGPRRLRLALQELGATFIKLGQLLSTRGDLLPPEYIDELSKLQDALPPVPLDSIARVIEAELGAPPEAVFVDFDPTPVAAASTSQVHIARLPEGQEVVVKVQRPGVASLFAEDLDIIHDIASLANSRTRLGRDYDLVGLADEMAVTLRPSLNYRVEGRNADRFRVVFKDEGSVYIPTVYWKYSTSRVLTMERLHGAKITDYAALDAMAIDRLALARQSARVLMRMVFEVGLFHADPHPGNFFIRNDGSLAIMDFGLVGHVGQVTRENLSRLFMAIVNRNSERMVDALTEIGALRHPQERTALIRDIERLLFEYYDLPLGEVPIGQLLADAMRVANRRSLQLPTDLALLTTVVAANEGMGRALTPGFRLLEEVKPYARHLFTEHFGPGKLAERFGAGLIDAVDVAPEMPARLQSVLKQVERGRLEVGVRSDQIDHLAHEVSSSANRLALSAIVAAFVISLAILVAVYHAPGSSQFSFILLVLGFLVASALGLWLVISILRSD